MNRTMITIIRRLTGSLLPLCLLTVLPLLVSCDEVVAHFVQNDEEDFVSELKSQKQEPAKVSKVAFSPDYKTFTVTTRMYEDIGPYSLLDSTRLRIHVKETVKGVIKHNHSAPKMIGRRNLKAENIAKAKICLLVLVDGTLSQHLLDRTREYVVELRAVFSPDNLFLSFMQGDSVSTTMRATDYVIDNYFNRSDADHVFLYRSILQKKDEMAARQGLWAQARKTLLLVFSNGKVYDDETDTPFDPDHFMLESQMAHPDSTITPDFMASYADMRPTREAGENHESAVLQRFCAATGGLYMSDYSGTEFKNNVQERFHISPDANEFTFENPDGKVYRGNFETLQVFFTDIATDSVVASFSTTINEGSIYNPIIVNGESIPVVIARSIVLAVIVLAVVWLLFQFIIPFIRYRIFLHKYVIRYTGGTMGVTSTEVRQSCYYCKQDFVPGDEIVVKCEHTMHKTCWDENEYHCPEYSDRCKHGSHYYNHQNLFDSGNASFYMNWIFMAVVAAWLAWLMFVFRVHTVTGYVISAIGGDQLIPNTPVSPLMSFGFAIGFFLSFGISMFSIRHYSSLFARLLSSLLRALLTAVGCWLVFLIFFLVVAVSDNDVVNILTEWIPWTLSGFIIAYIGTWRTRVTLRKSLVVPGIAFGIISMYAWWLFFDSDIDYRVLLLVSFIVYAIGLAVAVASITPRSERYFLKVEGAVKSMDIALYKWFRNAPDRVVTLGKSVDCSLQLSWDIQSDVAPVQAEIRMQQGNLYLTALEPGVFIQNKPLKPNKKVMLYHGKTFTIGLTTFTYVEKDR